MRVATYIVTAGAALIWAAFAFLYDEAAMPLYTAAAGVAFLCCALPIRLLRRGRKSAALSIATILLLLALLTYPKNFYGYPDNFVPLKTSH